ncbi:MAG: CpXC domain-containing protein [Anaerolineaceae bacterium]|nr:CpXC domain-containing protein [Anaerolineaceae bacterium]
MPKTQTSCPRCRQMVIADVEQLFDLNVDPSAKQRMLSGAVNVVHCPSCGYEGMLNVPIVYLDPEKELLLTHFPPDLGTPVNEQERMIGPYINRVVDNLAQEKRKGYLFNPQTMLSMQTLIEKVLEADGITKEMLNEQQKMVNLVEQLLNVSPEGRSKLITDEEKNINENIFALLTRLIQVSMSQGDQDGAKRLSDLQKELLEKTKVGRELEKKAHETNEIVKQLQEASKDGLTREKLLEIILDVKSDTGLVTIVSLTRQGIDYGFFEILTEKINRTKGDERTKLESIREKLLEMTSEFDKAIRIEMEKSRQILEIVLSSDDVEKELMQNINEINDYFVELVKSEIEQAEKDGATERLEKLQIIINTLQSLSAPPPEFALIDEFLAAENDDDLGKRINEHAESITPEFMQMFNNLILQIDQQDQPDELKARLKEIYRTVLRFSKKSNLSK